MGSGLLQHSNRLLFLRQSWQACELFAFQRAFASRSCACMSMVLRGNSSTTLVELIHCSKCVGCGYWSAVFGSWTCGCSMGIGLFRSPVLTQIPWMCSSLAQQCTACEAAHSSLGLVSLLFQSRTVQRSPLAHTCPTYSTVTEHVASKKGQAQTTWLCDSHPTHARRIVEHEAGSGFFSLWLWLRSSCLSLLWCGLSWWLPWKPRKAKLIQPLL